MNELALTSTSGAAAAKRPAAAEFVQRIARLRTVMAERGIQVAILDEIEALIWLSGYGSSLNRWRCIGIPLEGEPFYVIRALDAGPCSDGTWINDIRTFRDWDNPMDPLRDALRDRNLAEATIGTDFNSYCLSPNRLQEMRAALPRARIVDLGPVVNDLRVTKEPTEIEYLRRASAIADDAMGKVAAACRVGGSQRDIARIAMARYMELGGDPCLPGPIAAGQGWNFLHAAMSEQPLRAGDTVHIELVPRVAGYSARLMRCVTIGKPSADLARASEMLVELQNEQLAAIRPGVRAADVDAVLREGVLKSGLRSEYDNITGYTLGLYAPQAPRTSDFTRTLHPHADWVFQENMVFHIYASAAGASISETVLVTRAGSESLTRFPRKLILNPAGE